jgi:acetyl esterase
MPVDPQSRALLDQMAAAGAPPLDQLTPEQARAGFLAMRRLSGEPRLVASVEDRGLPGPAGEIPVRVYTLVGDGPFPVLVYFHGGGWVLGDLDGVDVPCAALADDGGCVVVSVDYRLAPDHKFPAAADDCFAATRYVAEHAREFNVDPSRLAVGGDSAGGNLAAVVTLMARQQRVPAIAWQLLVYPVTDYSFETVSYQENAEGYLLTRRSMEWFWGHYLPAPDDGHHPYASPLRASDLAALPPGLTITCEYDPLRDEGEAYAARLRAAGVAMVTRRYEGAIHGAFQLSGVLDQGKQMILDAGAALRAALARQPATA